MFIKFSMPSGVPRNLLFNTVESDDFLDVLTSGYIRRNGQKQVVSCHTIVLFSIIYFGISKSVMLDPTPIFVPWS